MLASRNGNPDTIRTLLEHHADVNGKDKLRGTTALMWAAEQGHPEAIHSANWHLVPSTLPQLQTASGILQAMLWRVTMSGL